MRKADFCVGLVVLGIGLLLSYGSLQLPTVEGILLGPGSLPLWLGIGLAVLSLILMLSSALGLTQDKVISWPQGTELRRIILVILCFAMYTAVISFLGYLVSTLLMLVVLIRVMGNFRWIFTIPISFVFSIALYVVFQVWLQIPLPSGLASL